MNHEIAGTQPSEQRTQLFTVRLWREPVEKGHMEIRGKVQYVLTGEVHYFRDWGALGTFMAAQMDTGEDDSAA